MGQKAEEFLMAKRQPRAMHIKHHDPKVTSIYGERGSWDAPAHDRERDQSYLKTVKPRTQNQEMLMKAIDAHALTLVTGPAGTGKTYLAVCKAVESLSADRVGKIVIARPVVEAGESLGFLPGDINEKMEPWMRPIYDALIDRMGGKQVRQMVRDGTIEISPLAYMRGRTISRSFVVVDEAQNMTFTQIKMLLTRLGWHSTMVVTGDPDQSDLPTGASGFQQAVARLDGLDGAAVVHLAPEDIVRHPLVSAMMPLLS
jgi:phosphate starvation-inducible PhoH-like protein